MSKTHEAFLTNLTFEQNVISWIFAFFLQILYLQTCVITVSCFYSHHSLLESSNHQDEEHSLIARYAARLAADAAVRYALYKTFIAHSIVVSFISVRCQKSVFDEKKAECMLLLGSRMFYC